MLYSDKFTSSRDSSTCEKPCVTDVMVDSYKSKREIYFPSKLLKEINADAASKNNDSSISNDEISINE